MGHRDGAVPDLGARGHLNVDALEATILQARHALLNVGPVPQQHECQN